MAKKMDKHIYSAKLVRVVDGDTCDAMIDLGFNVWVKNRIRFMGVDAWESRTRNLEEKEKGLAAKAYVKDLLENSDEGKFLLKSHGVGKYGRVLGELFVKGNEKRLTGQHETCPITEFRWGVSDRGASIRVPWQVAKDGKGYLEDRRPAANIDPYLVCWRLIKTICGEN